MKKKILLLLLLTMLISCNFNGINYSKENHSVTLKIKDNLYTEKYRVYSGGVCGGDVYTSYLTDSISFRIYLEKEFDDEVIEMFMLDSNFILVYKLDIHTYDTIKKNIYSIPQLKKEGKFE